MRGIESIECSCGGKPKSVETAEEEEERYGCGVPGCCVKAYVCPGCNTRWVLSLEAPEAGER